MQRREILKATLAAPLLTSSCGGNRSSETPDPIDALVSRTTDLKPIPQSEFDARLERLWRKLKDQKIAAFVAESGPTLEYLTGASWWRSERIFAAVIGVDRPPIFVCPGFEEERAREKIVAKDAEVRVWQEDESPYALLGKILSDLGIHNGICRYGTHLALLSCRWPPNGMSDSHPSEWGRDLQGLPNHEDTVGGWIHASG